MFKQLCRLQRYTFLHDLPNVYNTFLHELSARTYTFLHELFSYTYTFLHELCLIREKVVTFFLYSSLLIASTYSHSFL